MDTVKKRMTSTDDTTVDNNGPIACSALLVDGSTYDPDTLNLQNDIEANDYWFGCIADLVKKFAKQAAHSQRNDSTACERAALYQDQLLKMIAVHKERLKDTSNDGDRISIRTLLELNESHLRLHGFNDPWCEEKQMENMAAIAQLNERLQEIDHIHSSDERWLQIFRGFFAGNIFDWGAQAVTQIRENNQAFGLDEALRQIESRPWLIDGLDEWISRLQKGSPHKCAVIFVDNSGVDIVLGVIPFVRELLRRGTNVLLCANSKPSLNDITVDELTKVIAECSKLCTIIREAIKLKNLRIFSNGQIGPCLDLRRLPIDLVQAIEANETDLLIIEGMGRALHTNFYVKFNCETLKLAVVKNKWWADRLGGDNFSVICKYEST